MKPFFKDELSQSIQFQSRGGYTLFQQHHLSRKDGFASLEAVEVDAGREVCLVSKS